MGDIGHHGAGRRGASAVRSRHLAAACAAVIASVTFGINMRDANPDRQYAAAVARAAIVTGAGGASRAVVGSDLANVALSGSRRADAEAGVSASAPRTPSNSSYASGARRDAVVGAVPDGRSAGLPNAGVGVNPYAAYLLHQAEQRADNLRAHPVKGWWPVISISLWTGAMVPLWLLLGRFARRYR